MINSVRGPLDPGALGVTLMHEHVLVDFAGAALAHRSRYDADEAFALVLPHLERLHNRGCRTLVECTPAYLGRDVELLARLSEASGLHILTNTGYVRRRPGSLSAATSVRRDIERDRSSMD